MRRLIILRHAKSSWAEPGKSDYERELNDRGQADLPKIARYFAQSGYVCDKILCSAAARTRLTYDGIKDANPDFCENIEYHESLYESTVEVNLRTIKECMDQEHCLLIIGHNPTCDALANLLTKDGDEVALNGLAAKFPTGAFAVIDLAIDEWSEIGANCGTLIDFKWPKAL